MVLVMNDDRVSDTAAYLPLARDFAEDSVHNEKGCHSMKVMTDPKTPGRVVYISVWDSAEDFRNSVGGTIFQKHIPKMGKYFISASDTIFDLYE